MSYVSVMALITGMVMLVMTRTYLKIA
jgi:hypothetical protein